MTTECVPTGTPITDVDTGEVYYYQVPGPYGTDSCGVPIPDICVKWPSGFYSTLWLARDCAPVEVPVTTEVVATAVVGASETTVLATPMLPQTGSTTEMAILGLALIAAGVAMRMFSRKGVRS